jgi:hypothetical protein
MSPSRFPPRPSGAPGRLIPGVYNYCDRWCERCTLSARCRVFQHQLVFDAATKAGCSLEQAMDRAESAVDLLDGPEPPVPPSWERERSALLDVVNREPTQAEMARWLGSEKRRRAWADAQPISRAAQDYMHLSLDIVIALEKLARPDADPLAVAALHAIHHHSFLIRSKLYRAMSGSWTRFDPTADPDDDDVDDDDEFAVHDANGSAHVALRAIVESREAWQTIAASPRLASSGVAPAMIRRLAELETGVSARFPGARSFKRPGFDDATRA